MNSPFPGMDPFLEAKWPEVHASLIVYSRNELNRQLPDDLQANIEESISVQEDETSDVRSIRPDVNVSEDAQDSSSEANVSHVAVAQPIRLRRAPRPDRHIAITTGDWRRSTGDRDRDHQSLEQESEVPQEKQDQTIHSTALGRLGTPADIANIVAFLCSADARWLTGQIIDANGGLRRG